MRHPLIVTYHFFRTCVGHVSRLRCLSAVPRTRPVRPPHARPANAIRRSVITLQRGHCLCWMPSPPVVRASIFLYQQPLRQHSMPIPCLTLCLPTGRDLHSDDDIRLQLHQIRLMADALCADRGIIPSDIPGFNDLPPRRPNSPGQSPSASSPGIPISALTISDTSGRSSVASDRPNTSGKHIYCMQTVHVISS